MHNGISCRLSGTVSSLMTQLGSRPVVPNRGEISPLGEILVFLGGNSGRAGNINNAVNIAIINIHVSLIFLNNSWNHSTDKYKSQFVASYVYLSTKYRIILTNGIDIFLILSIFLTALENTYRQMIFD